MRRLLCNKLGIKDWDWRLLNNRHFFKAAISELKGKINENRTWENLQ
jgi:hypothetical protein